MKIKIADLLEEVVDARRVLQATLEALYDEQEKCNHTGDICGKCGYTGLECQSRGRMFAVFAEMSEPGSLPMALFREKEDAERWADQHDFITRADLYVTYWGGTGDDPKRTFKDFEPYLRSE